MDVHTLINGLAAELRQLRGDLALMKASLDEMAVALAEATAKPEPEKHPKKGGD